jgi:hypothetical protein
MVNNVIESCKNDQKITPIFLYGVSGSGKTKTLYDVLKENFGIFFDFNKFFLFVLELRIAIFCSKILSSKIYICFPIYLE